MPGESHRIDFGNIAEAYERGQVPAIFAGWAVDLLEVAALHPGERVLDLACGTGILARLAAPQVTAAGRVVGLDVNEAMLAVARAQSPPAGAVIEWHHGNAATLPFADGSFDVVLCQQGLQHMEDRAAAVGEMRRVLVPNGRAVVSMFSRRVDQEAWETVAARFIGPDAAARIGRGPWRRLAADELCALFREAGFCTVESQTRARATGFDSPDAFIDYQLSGQNARLYRDLGPDRVAALRAEARTAFEPYRIEGRLAFPQEAHVVVARATPLSLTSAGPIHGS
jgi:ubiquinone/menaquinone biosynthesis C-methylase UbiE